MSRKLRKASVLAGILLTVLALVLTACGGGGSASPTAASTPTPTSPPATAPNTPAPQTPTSTLPLNPTAVKELTGGGATFPFPLYSKMFDAYNKQFGVRVNYQSIGSGAGIQQLQQQILDFGGSDAIMTPEQQAQAKGGHVLHIPTAAGAEAIVYNLQGVPRGQLKLSPDILADIYLKKIRKWNDPRIASLNPNLNLPSTDITVVHRADGSGTTFIFTNYLSKVSQEWKDRVGSSTSVKWPGDIGGQGNEGVSGQVRQLPGAIGYVELAFALQNNLPWVALQNKAGKFIEPSLDSAALAADVPNLPDNMEVVITNSDSPNAYPIVGFTWLLVYENQTNRARAETLASLVWWVTHAGQQFAAPLDYAPLKGQAVTKAENLVKLIKVNGQPLLSR